MTAYQTIDYLPDLTNAEMSGARTLTFSHYVPATSLATKWDNSATYYTSQQYALLASTFKWTGREGATYDISSSSYFDPYLIQVYDALGNVVAVDGNGIDPYGTDYVWGFVAPYTGTYYVSAGWNQGSASSNRFVSLSIYEDVDTTYKSLTGTSGTDRFTATNLVDYIYGGGGIDFVTFSGPKSGYTISRRDAQTVDVTDRATGLKDVLWDVERLIFTDVRTSLTTAEDGPVYRMYRAAFDRAPDPAGMGYQLSSVYDGLSLVGLAQNFIASPEFQRTYGALNDPQFVTQLYQNVLHRAPDASGLAFYTSSLSRGTSRADVLVGFSESPENQAAVIGIIANGIDYTI